MSDKRYLGNIITDTPTAPANNFETTSAAGVWSLAEAFAYTKAGLWPTAGNVNVRMVIQNGRPAGNITSVMESIQVAVLGNSVDFGDIAVEADKAWKNASGASSTRGVIAGGNSNNSAIQYSTIATGGNTVNFGTLASIGREGLSGSSNGVIAIFAGGENSGVRDTGDQVTISTTGNSTNFGDLRTRVYEHASCGSNSRAIMAGGRNSGGSTINEIQYYTYASQGTSQDFGDLTEVKKEFSGASNSTRGVFSGNEASTNTYDYITIATTGNAVDFGDMRLGPINGLRAASSSTRCVWAGGNEDSTGTDIYTRIDYVEIATTGNGLDFGTLTTGAYRGTAFSNGHGGL
tara:strand:- start:1 stop:1041 length:1041 start_codon:yes stop_codon:yes gene_type:complete